MIPVLTGSAGLRSRDFALVSSIFDARLTFSAAAPLGSLRGVSSC